MITARGYLMIGGPLDGQRRVLPPGAHDLTVLQIFDAPTPREFLEADALSAQPVVVHPVRYRVLDAPTRTGPIALLVVEGLTLRAAIARLMAGYDPARARAETGE